MWLIPIQSVILSSKRSWNSYVMHMQYSGVLIQVGTELLRNRRMFTYSFFSNYIFDRCKFCNQYMYLLKKSTFSTTRAVINIEIDNVIEFGKEQLQNIERDFKSEFLFRANSIATILVTSIEFQSIQCAIMLSPLDQLRNGSVVTHFDQFSCTATNSATWEYITVPQCIGQKTEPISGNDERTKKKPSSCANCI